MTPKTVIDKGANGSAKRYKRVSDWSLFCERAMLDNGWPLELVSTPEFTANKYNISDLGSFVAPVRRMGTISGQAAFSSRWDLAPGDSGLTSSGWINIVDLGATIGGPTGFPPMLGGAKAMGGPVCPFPP